MMMRLVIFSQVLLLVVSLNGQDLSGIEESNSTYQGIRRHLLLCCGLPGDDQHRQQMTEACRQIISASEPVLGVQPEDLRVLAGDEEMQTALQELHDNIGVTTAEALSQSLSNVADSVPSTDGFWCILIGHSHPYGAESQFNILGKDIHQGDFAQFAKGIECREQVYWLTQPLSGFWIKPLARPGRIILSATEADLEFTGTEMPYALGTVLAGESDTQIFEDIDGDSATSLLDLYLAVSLEVAGRFRAIDRLQTEHSQLEDNGDGRGNEVQQPYLPVEPEEEDESEEDESDDDESDDDESDDENEDDEEEASTPDLDQLMPVAKPPLVQNRNMDGYRSRYVILRVPSIASPQESDEAPSPEEDTQE